MDTYEFCLIELFPLSMLLMGLGLVIMIWGTVIAGAVMVALGIALGVMIIRLLASEE